MTKMIVHIQNSLLDRNIVESAMWPGAIFRSSLSWLRFVLRCISPCAIGTRTEFHESRVVFPFSPSFYQIYIDNPANSLSLLGNLTATVSDNLAPLGSHTGQLNQPFRIGLSHRLVSRTIPSRAGAATGHGHEKWWQGH